MTDEQAFQADPWGRPSVRWNPDPAANAAARAAARGPRVPAGPGWLPIAAGLAGLVGAISLPDAPPGIGVALTVAAITAALVPAMRDRLTGWNLSAGAAVLVLAAMTAVRDAEWLVALNLLAAFALGSIVLAGATNFRDMILGSAAVGLAAPMAPPYVGRAAVSRLRSGSSRRWGATLRAALLSVGLLVVFGALFSSADAAFGEIAAAVTPDVSLGMLPAHVFVFFVVVFLVASGALVAGRVAPIGLSRGLTALAEALTSPLDTQQARFRPSRREWVLPLALLDAMFVVFVVVQFAVFFGGREHLVETPGLTAAEYARSGFFQLVTVCVLTLIVIAAAARWVADEADRPLLRLLLGPLCLLTGVVLLSAALRLHHYQDAFGYTRLRLVVAAVMIVIAVVLAMVLVAGARWRARWLPRGVVAAGVAALIGLNLLNADAFIARRNIDLAGAGVQIDTRYLSGLSADAAPELLDLPEPARTCALAGIRSRIDRLDDGGWRGANLSRSRARNLNFASARPTGCP